MTRLLALSAIAGLVVGLWLNLRDLLAKVPVQPDPADDVQGPDPRTTRPVIVTLPNSLSVAEVGHIRTWLDAHPDVLEELYESQPLSTQTGPLGPSA